MKSRNVAILLGLGIAAILGIAVNPIFLLIAVFALCPLMHLMGGHGGHGQHERSEVQKDQDPEELRKQRACH